MFSTVSAAGIFLVKTVFDIYIFVIMFRLLMQWAGVRYTNPMAQFVCKLTDPLVLRLRKILPRVAQVDLATLLLLFIVEIVKILTLIALFTSLTFSMNVVLVGAIVDLTGLLINIFFYSILIVVIVSWINPALINPVIAVLYMITEPLLTPVRRVIPPVAGFDISPLVVLLLLQLLSILISFRVY